MTYNIGDKYLYKGKTVTVTKTSNRLVWFEGSGIGGSASKKYFASNITKISVPKKTAKVTSVTKVPIKSAGLIETEDTTTGILKLTKTGTTKLYVGVSIIAIVIIFGGFKIFKKYVL